MKSSSIPPAVVTIAETCPCFTRNRMTSRKPDDIKLDVYPSNTLHLVFSLTSGLRSSSESFSEGGSSERRQFRCIQEEQGARIRGEHSIVGIQHFLCSSSRQGIFPADHVIHNFDSASEASGLESNIFVAFQEVLKTDLRLKIRTPHWYSVRGNGF